MASRPFSFELHATDPGSAARLSTFTTPHGSVELPAFMPVGTQGTVKGVTVDQLRATGTQMMLANTYHLALRPGAEVVRVPMPMQPLPVEAAAVEALRKRYSIGVDDFVVGTFGLVTREKRVDEEMGRLMGSGG